MKKTVKVVTTLLIMMFILTSMASLVFATDYDPKVYTGQQGMINTAGISNMGQNIIFLIRMVGSIVAVAVLVVIGIKYMIGSAEEKAKYKEVMIPYIIGAVLIFAATWIASAIYQFAQGFAQ